MRAGRWAMGWFWGECLPDGISRRPSRNRPHHLVAEGVNSTASSVAGRFFELLGRLQDGFSAARKPVVSVPRTVRTVRTVFPISRQEVEKRRVKEKGKVERKKNRPNRLAVLRPAIMFVQREVSA